VGTAGSRNHRDLADADPAEPVPEDQAARVEPSEGSPLDRVELGEGGDAVDLVVEGDDARAAPAVRSHSSGEDDHPAARFRGEPCLGRGDGEPAAGQPDDHD
jgi:hypothetical protein